MLLHRSYFLQRLSRCNRSQRLHRYTDSAPSKPGYAGWNDPAQPSPSYPQQTVAFVAGLAAKYGTNPALIGIELLNDPMVSGLPEQWPDSGVVQSLPRSTFDYAESALCSMVRSCEFKPNLVISGAINNHRSPLQPSSTI